MLTLRPLWLACRGFQDAVALANEHELLTLIGIHQNVTERYPTIGPGNRWMISGEDPSDLPSRIWPSMYDSNNRCRIIAGLFATGQKMRSTM
jgi:hypothetical protein